VLFRSISERRLENALNISRKSKRSLIAVSLAFACLGVVAWAYAATQGSSISHATHYQSSSLIQTAFTGNNSTACPTTAGSYSLSMSGSFTFPLVGGPQYEYLCLLNSGNQATTAITLSQPNPALPTGWTWTAPSIPQVCSPGVCTTNPLTFTLTAPAGSTPGAAGPSFSVTFDSSP